MEFSFANRLKAMIESNRIFKCSFFEVLTNESTPGPHTPFYYSCHQRIHLVAGSMSVLKNNKNFISKKIVKNGHHVVEPIVLIGNNLLKHSQ